MNRACYEGAIFVGDGRRNISIKKLNTEIFLLTLLNINDNILLMTAIQGG